MPDTALLLLTLLATALAGAAGYAWAHARAQRQLATEREEKAVLRGELEAERRAVHERNAALEAARQQLTERFTHLSAEALARNNEAFLRLANENLGRFQGEAKGELEQRKQAVEALVKPLREALERTERQIRQMESERKEAYGSLTRHLETMAQTQQSLQAETRNLVQALRRPEVRGQWGEMTLRRLVELAGMVEHCDFFEQEHTPGEGGALRPDMVVRMPGGREIVVDVKTPLDAYLDAVNAADDGARDLALDRHARNVRNRVRELAAKGYWQQFSQSPDFVVLFIPGEQFLSSALDRDHKLLEEALAQRVILATPTSLVALLRAVAYGWRQEQLAANAEEIRKAGEELYSRLATFADHLGKLGRSLGSSVDHFNRAVGSFDSRVLPGARRFVEMGVGAQKEVAQPEQIDKLPRSVENTPES